MKNIFIQSISSDIGINLAQHWIGKGHKVFGTYRTMNENLNQLVEEGLDIVRCDLTDMDSIKNCVQWISSRPVWDVTILGAGVQDPIGPFITNDFDEWEQSVCQNFTSQFRLIHGILNRRNLGGKHPPVVLMFAGGGTNNATTRYSAYTISKIACIKMCELLDAEIQDTVFTIVGPGWVKTKIHESTLAAKDKAGDNYSKTVSMLNEDRCFPMEKVVDCCDWLINADRSLVGGRNFSAANDPWGDEKIQCITQDANNFKLRRFGNQIFE